MALRSALVPWVDELCINQQNVDERSSQVEMMREIYSSANGVMIWRGEADYERNDAFDAMSRVAGSQLERVMAPGQMAKE